MNQKSGLSLLLLLAILPLTACQSINSLTDADIKKQPPEAQSKLAKTELQKALKAKFDQSFNYHSAMILSNKALRQTSNTTIESAKNAENCQRNHDTAYVAVLKKNDGNTFDNTQAEPAIENIKNRYLTCTKVQGVSLTDSQDQTQKTNSGKLLDAYLSKPLELDITGTYQPKAGKFSLMPSLTYQSRHSLLNKKLPIYVDFKTGDIYLWADLFAQINAKMLDDTLGTQWKNKWLKLSLNDGSLPKDFGKNFLKIYLKALETTYQKEPASGFSYLTLEQLKASQSNISAKQNKNMDHAGRIILREHNPAINEEQYYLFQKEWLKGLNKKYPDLMKGTNNSDNAVATSTLLNIYLAHVKKLISTYEIKHVEGNASASKVEGIHSKEYYAIEKGKIKWIYTDYNLTKDKTPTLEMNALTTFSEADNTVFANLPLASRVPTADNSLDIQSYGQKMVEHYQQGDETAVEKADYLDYQTYFERAKSARDNYSTETNYPDFAESETQPNKKIVYDEGLSIVTLEGDGKKNGVTESANCVLISVAIDMMCEKDSIDINNPEELEQCKEEQVSTKDAYKFYCR